MSDVEGAHSPDLLQMRLDECQPPRKYRFHRRTAFHGGAGHAFHLAEGAFAAHPSEFIDPFDRA
jgi:hypothetical protein